MTKIGGIAIHLHKGGWKIWKIGPMISWPDGVPMQDGEAPVDGDPEGVIVIVRAGEIVPVVVLGGPLRLPGVQQGPQRELPMDEGEEKTRRIEAIQIQEIEGDLVLEVPDEGSR